MTKEQIITSTIEAMKLIKQNRFYKSERGYHGKFYCGLQSALDRQGILSDDLILEIKYQKSTNRHGTGQRPDIILHIPTEATGAPVAKNNFAVWALKHSGSDSEAKADFEKLDSMFEQLDYQVGFFVNVSSDKNRLNKYEGSFPDRLIAFAVKLTDDLVQIKQATNENGRIIEIKHEV